MDPWRAGGRAGARGHTASHSPSASSASAFLSLSFPLCRMGPEPNFLFSRAKPSLTLLWGLEGFGEPLWPVPQPTRLSAGTCPRTEGCW